MTEPKNCCVNPTLPKESQTCEFSSLFVCDDDKTLYINDLKEFENHTYCSLHNPSPTKKNYADFLQNILDNFLSGYQSSKTELNFDHCFFNENTNFFLNYRKDFNTAFKDVTLNFKNTNFLKGINISKSIDTIPQIGCQIIGSEIKGDLKIQDVSTCFLIQNSIGKIPKLELIGFCETISVFDNNELEIEELSFIEGIKVNEPSQATKILIANTKIKKAVFQSIYSVSKKMLFSPLNNDAEVHFGGKSTPITQKLLRSLNAYNLGVSNKLEEIETEEIKLVGVNKIYFDYTGSGAKKINIVNVENMELNGNLYFGETFIKNSSIASSIPLAFQFENMEIIFSSFKQEMNFRGDFANIIINNSNFESQVNIREHSYEEIKFDTCTFLKKVYITPNSNLNSLYLKGIIFEGELRIASPIKKLFFHEGNIFKKYIPNLIDTKIPRKFKLPINKKESFSEIEDKPNPDNQKYAQEIYCQLMDLKEYLEAGFYYSLAEKYKEWKGNKIAKLYSILSDSGYSLWKLIKLYFGALLVIYIMAYGFTLNTESFYSFISNMINPIYIITKEKTLLLSGNPICAWIKLSITPLASITQALSMFLLGIAIRWRCRKL